MRAQPATSEERRAAAQLVAYGGSRTGSMREGAHPGRIAAYPAQNLSLEAIRTQGVPLVTPPGRAGRKSTTREPIIQESEAPEPLEPEATRRQADTTESARANRGW